MSAAIVHVTSAVDAVRSDFDWTPEQRRMIRNAYANGASDDEFEVLLGIARARRLNPLLKQIHFVKRYDGQRRCEVWSAQASIDGLRAIAERTAKYDGQDEPEFVGKDGRLECCKVRVYRKDWTRPAVGVAYWDEYVQTTKEGHPTRFWKQMPHVMLSKCAEAIALRKAFPEDTSGLYIQEEMGSSRPAVQDEGPPPEAEEQERKLLAALEASVDWSRWAQDHLKSLGSAEDAGALLEAWVAVNDDVKRLQPPKQYVDALKDAKDEAKRLLGGVS